MKTSIFKSLLFLEKYYVKEDFIEFKFSLKLTNSDLGMFIN